MNSRASHGGPSSPGSPLGGAGRIPMATMTHTVVPEQRGIGSLALAEARTGDRRCGQYCGGLQNLVFERVQAPAPGNWSYVGDGRGAYEKLETYNFVGEGAGNFENVVTLNDSYRVRRCSLFVIMAAIFVACAALSIALWRRYQEKTLFPSQRGYYSDSGQLQPVLNESVTDVYTHPPLIVGTTTAPRYDCERGFFTWQATWIPAKKKWCCERYIRGCESPATTAVPTLPVIRWATTAAPTLPPYSVTRSVVYDCEAGLVNWRIGWAMGKKAWCCEHERVGCPEMPTTKTPASALALGTTMVLAIATTHPPGVDSTTTTTLPTKTHLTSTMPYDCDAGFPNWEKGWSRTKKTWCCVNMGKACDPYDCKADVDKFDTRWPSAKKVWCCIEDGLACITTATTTVTTHTSSTSTVIPQPTAQTSTTAPPSSATAMPYDCNEGLSHWEKLWNVPKRIWCCESAGTACDPYDCNQDLATLDGSWIPPKKAWCCEHGGFGCASTPVPGAR